MASPSSNPDVTLEVREEYPYPYPSNVYTPSFVTVKLNGKDKYGIWKTQILCLLESHGMLGFIDGTHVNPHTSVTGKEKVGDHETRQGLWRRSDALVKGWILGSLSEETFRCVLNSLARKSRQQIDGDFRAKDVWDELQTMYGPPQLQTVYGPVGLPQQAGDKQEDKRRAVIHQRFYMAVLEVRSDVIDAILCNEEVTVIDKITNNGNTALHVAVGATRNSELLQKLLELTPENTQLLDLRNSDGSTLLHVAAIVGNTQAADILVGKNPELLFAKDNEGHTPLAIALSNMHTETAQHLLQHIDSTDHMEKGALFSGESGDELLVTAISSKDFRLAFDLLERYITLNSDAVLMAIALNFPRELTMLEEFSSPGELHWKMERALVTAFDYTVRKCGTRVGKIISKFYVGWPYIKERIRTHHDAIEMFAVCVMIRHKHDSMSYNQYYMKALFEAIRQNKHEVVEEIVFYFPDARSSANEEGHNIIQHAVINRSENIYNILYKMSEHKNVYRTIKDPSGNNLLHFAARTRQSVLEHFREGGLVLTSRDLRGLMCSILKVVHEGLILMRPFPVTHLQRAPLLEQTLAAHANIPAISSRQFFLR
ncbi:hypothetical protein LXL04_027893 [Taraxacum kok-saghyz]